VTHFSAQRFQLLRQLGQPLGRCWSLPRSMTYLSVGLAATLTLQSQLGEAIAQTTELPPLQSLPQTPATPITETVLYVNPVLGMDSNSNGSVNAPLKTLTYALEIARPNTTIQLAPGLYSVDSGEVFPISLKPNVTITGQPKTFGQTIILRGGGAFRSPTLPPQNVTILAGANQAIVEGLTILNPNPDGYAIQVEASSPTIRYTTLTGNGSAIALTGNSQSQIQNNLIINNQQHGIAIFGAARPVIDRNVFEQTGLAIVVDGTAAPLIQNNRLTKNLSGIVVQGTAQPKIHSNTIESNLEYGVLAKGQARPELGEATQKNTILNNGKADTSLSLAGLQAPKEQPPAIAAADQPEATASTPAEAKRSPAPTKTTTAIEPPTPAAPEKSAAATPTNAPAAPPQAQTESQAPQKSAPAIAPNKLAPTASAPTAPAAETPSTDSASAFLQGIQPESAPTAPTPTPAQSSKPPGATLRSPAQSSESAATTKPPATQPSSSSTAAAIEIPAPQSPPATAAPTPAPPAIAFGQTLPETPQPSPPKTTPELAPTSSTPKAPAIVVPVEPVTAPLQLPEGSTPNANNNTKPGLETSPPLANLETPTIAESSLTQANFPIPSALRGQSSAPALRRDTQTPSTTASPPAIAAPRTKANSASSPSLRLRANQSPPPSSAASGSNVSAASFPVPNANAPTQATPKLVIQPAPKAYTDRPVPSPVLPLRSPTPQSQAIQREAAPIPIPVPPPENPNPGLPNLMPLPAQQPVVQPVITQKLAFPQPTALATAQPPAKAAIPSTLLPVPSSEIPVGNIGDMPKVYTVQNGGTLARTSSMSNAGVAASPVKYRVVVQVQTESQKAQIKTLFPAAFSSQFQGRSVWQVGAFSDRSKAEQLTQTLASQGFAAASEVLR